MEWGGQYQDFWGDGGVDVVTKFFGSSDPHPYPPHRGEGKDELGSGPELFWR